MMLSVGEGKKMEVESHSKYLKNASNPILLEHKWKERKPYLYHYNGHRSSVASAEKSLQFCLK